MNLIVAVDKNWGIGYQNKLLNSIPEDMKYFRETTTGKVVVMGRKTLESFPNGLPLKNRTNIVITGDHTYKAKDAIIVHSIDRQLLPYCDVAHVTCMDYTYQADTWFPNLDEDKDWVVAADSEERTYFDLEYCFKMYVRKTKLKEIVDLLK